MVAFRFLTVVAPAKFPVHLAVFSTCFDAMLLNPHGVLYILSV